MASYDSYIHPQVEEAVRELVTKTVAANPALLSSPMRLGRKLSLENGHTVSKVYVVGKVDNSEKVWVMIFSVRNLMVDLVLCHVVMEHEAENLVPPGAWKSWDRNRKVLWSGHFVNRHR